MGATNIGNQINNWKYKGDLKSEYFNRTLKNGIKKGVYEGGQLTVINTSTLEISSLVAYVETTDNEKVVRVETQQTIQKTIDISKPILYIKFEWINQIENYADFEFRAEGDTPVNGEVKLGKCNFSGSNLISFDTSYNFRDIGLFNDNGDLVIDDAIINNSIKLLTSPSGSDPTSIGNISFNDERYLREDTFTPTINKLDARVTSNENSILQLQIQNIYQSQRKYNTSDFILETFMDNDDTVTLDTLSNPVDLRDDNDFKNNWIERNGLPNFKNGYIRQHKYNYMLEIMDKFNLEGVGQTHKASIDYDSVNNCYWMMSNNGANTLGEITKLSENLLDGKVEVLARFYVEARASAYWTGICNYQGTDLFFTAYGTDAASIAYKISIDSDGTLNGVGNGETIGLGSDTSAEWANIFTGLFNDIMIYDSNDVGILLANGTTDVSIRKRSIASLGTATGQDITGLENFMGDSAEFAYGLAKSGNDLYILTNTQSNDNRWIYKFDITSDIKSGTPNSFIKTSGRFELSTIVDSTTVGGHGITIGHDGNFYEVVSSTSNGKFLSKRALSLAYWAENQVSGTVEATVYDSTNLPNTPRACLVESDRYYWTGDLSVTANQVDLFRYDDESDAFKHARLTGASWTSIYDMTIDAANDRLWLLGSDGTNFELYYGDLSDFVDNEMGDVYSTGNTVILGTDWGTLATGVGAANTDGLWGVCHDSTNNILYLLNNTDDKIDTLSEDGATWTQGVYDLDVPTSHWMGIACKFDMIYVRDWTSSTAPNKVYAIPLDKANSSTMWVKHTYQDSSANFTGNGAACIDFDGNDLVSVNIDSIAFSKMKLIENPNVLQLQSFPSENNILLENKVTDSTEIVNRYFNNESNYTDIRDMPDKYYQGVIYEKLGFSLLMLDDFYNDYSSAGLPRYDVRKIRTVHYESNQEGDTYRTKVLSWFLNYAPYATAIKGSAISIKNDTIFVTWSLSTAGNAHYFCYINLKNGVAYANDGTSTLGLRKFQKTLSERNVSAVANYWGDPNPELLFSAVAGPETFKIHSRTFSKDDASNYNYANKRTYSILAGEAGADVLVEEWDENENKTPVKVWKSVFGNANVGNRSVFIAEDGRVYAGFTDSTGDLYALSNGTSQPPIKIWELEKDGSGISPAIVSLRSAIIDIAERSPYWRDASGNDNQLLYVGTQDLSITSTYDYGLHVVDVEKETYETIYEIDTTTVDSDDAVKRVDIFEENVFGITANNLSSTEVIGGLVAFKKLRMESKMNSVIKNDWDGSIINTQYALNSTDRPYFSLSPINTDTGFVGPCKFSSTFGVLTTGNSVNGLQLLHFIQNNDECLHKSTTYNILSNPSQYHYTNSQLNNTGFKIDSKIDNSTWSYTNSSGDGDGQKSWVTDLDDDTREIARENGASAQGYTEKTGITGYDTIKLLFKTDDNSGGAKITVTNTTDSIVLTNWNGKEIDLFYDATTSNDTEFFACWITLDSTKTYTIKIENSGLNNAGADDYLRFFGAYPLTNLTNGDVDVTLVTNHTSHTSETNSFTVTKNDSVDLTKIETFVAVQDQTNFVLSGTERAHEFLEASFDSGATWVFRDSVEFSWGSNATDYDDETIDSNGYFGIKTVNPKNAGDNVWLKYTPKINQYYVQSTLKQANDGSTFKSFGDSTKLLDYGMELK
jgi:hypothetical protein